MRGASFGILSFQRDSFLLMLLIAPSSLFLQERTAFSSHHFAMKRDERCFPLLDRRKRKFLFRCLRSVTLQADAHHLFADVLTTVGVLIGVLLVALTKWYILDPVVALLVAANIVWTGLKLLRQTGLGLLDTALPQEDQEQVKAILATYQQQGLEFHAIRSRMAGRRRFISFPLKNRYLRQKKCLPNLPFDLFS